MSSRCDAPFRPWRELIHRIADRADHIDVATLGLAADVVGLAHAAAFQHQRQRLRMVVDKQPVANIESAAVDRHRLALEPLDDRQRDQLFRKLMRSVIVRAVGEQDRQPIGMAPRSHQMVGRRLGGRIGRARIVAGLFGEISFVRQRAIDLVGRDMQEPKVFGARAELAPMRKRGLEQDIGADDIGVDEFGGPVDRSVDVTFGRQMHHRVGIEARKNLGDGRTIADIGAAELIARMALHRSERGEIAGIGQLVDDQAPRGRCGR